MIPLRAGLPDGDYTVLWRVLSDDGHKLSGVIAFGVGASRAPPEAALSADNGPSAQDVVSRLLFFAGLLTAAGAAFFRFAVGPVPVRLMLGAFLLVFVGVSGVAHDASLSTRFGTVMAVAAVISRHRCRPRCRGARVSAARTASLPCRFRVAAAADARGPRARSRQAATRACGRLPACCRGLLLARRPRCAWARAHWVGRPCSCAAPLLQCRARVSRRSRGNRRDPRARGAALARAVVVDRLRAGADREDGTVRGARHCRLGEPLPASAQALVRRSCAETSLSN